MCWKTSFEQSAVLTNSVDREHTTNAFMHTYSQRHAYTHEYIHACMYTDLIRHQLHNWGQTKRFKDGETCVTLSVVVCQLTQRSVIQFWHVGCSYCAGEANLLCLCELGSSYSHHQRQVVSLVELFVLGWHCNDCCLCGVLAMWVLMKSWLILYYVHVC